MGTYIRRAFLILMPAMILFAMYGFTKAFGAPGSLTNFINKQALPLVMKTPEALTFAGLDGLPFDNHSHKLSDYTGAVDDEIKQDIIKAQKALTRFDYEGLDRQDRLTYDIVTWMIDNYLAGEKYEYSGYPISQLSGPHINLPSFLTDQHKVNSRDSATNYLARLRDFGRVLDETHGVVDEYARNGVIAPDFIIGKTVEVLEAFIEDGPAQNVLVTSLSERLDELDSLDDAAKRAFLDEAETIIRDIVAPGYEKLIAQQKALLPRTNSDAGIWSIPDGEAIYALAIRNNTTLDQSADDIHAIGLSEVARIEKAMDAILVSEGYTDGTVGERVMVLMEAPEQLYPNTDEGREDMIAYLEELNENILKQAGEYFVTLPPQKLEIKRIPKFSEGSAPGGYYQPPTPSLPFISGRPGQFYINQKDTADNPKWTLPSLLYHEAAPGHHFQISRAMIIEDVPILRQFSPFSAYTEGWALYAERMAAEDMGLYADNPLGDLGRLQAEQFRAVRLVVDTGLHHKRWTREQAIEFMLAKTGMTEDNVTREIERYVVWPGQALAYKTGQLAILRMRARAEKALGDKFNLRLFNEMILEDGAMPLGMLDREVDGWIAEQQG